MDGAFTKLDLPKMYPLQEIADHEVLMTFNGDSDALAWREWWDEEGAYRFNHWLQDRQKKGGEQ